MTAFADDYESQLRQAGFTSKYIPALKVLHEKYPNWQFEAVQINLSLDDAVSQERKSHKQQLIQNISQNNGITVIAVSAMLTVSMLFRRVKRGFLPPKQQ